MRLRILALAAGLACLWSAPGLAEEGPSYQDLGDLLAKDVPLRGRGPHLRQLSCESFLPEQPQQYLCYFLLRAEGRAWVPQSVIVARDGDGWRLVGRHEDEVLGHSRHAGDEPEQ